MASRAVSKLRQPLVELVGLAVSRVARVGLNWVSTLGPGGATVNSEQSPVDSPLKSTSLLKGLIDVPASKMSNPHFVW